MTAVVWSERRCRYVLRSFDRDDPACAGLLTHLDRPLVTRVTLRAGLLRHVRCASYTDVPADELFAAPGAAGRTCASFLEASGCVEAIWYPFTDAPWAEGLDRQPAPARGRARGAGAVQLPNSRTRCPTPSSARSAPKYASLQDIRGGTGIAGSVGRPPTEPKVRGSNPLGRASRNGSRTPQSTSHRNSELRFGWEQEGATAGHSDRDRAPVVRRAVGRFRDRDFDAPACGRRRRRAISLIESPARGTSGGTCPRLHADQRLPWLHHNEPARLISTQPDNPTRTGLLGGASSTRAGVGLFSRRRHSRARASDHARCSCRAQVEWRARAGSSPRSPLQPRLRDKPASRGGQHAAAPRRPISPAEP